MAKAKTVVVDGLDVRKEIVRVWRIARKLEPNLGRLPAISISVSRDRFGTSGHASIRSGVGSMHITCGASVDDLRSTIAHEIAHHICFVRFERDPHHGEEFYSAWWELMREAGIEPTRCRGAHNRFNDRTSIEMLRWHAKREREGR